jgi:hypothetical protein
MVDTTRQPTQMSEYAVHPSEVSRAVSQDKEYSGPPALVPLTCRSGDSRNRGSNSVRTRRRRAERLLSEIRPQLLPFSVELKRLHAERMKHIADGDLHSQQHRELLNKIDKEMSRYYRIMAKFTEIWLS